MAYFTYGEFKMKMEPWDHQLHALRYLYPRDCGALYTPPGSGKTKVIIDLIVNRGFKRIVIVAPKVPCSDVWPKEIKKHSDIPKDCVHHLYAMSGKKKAEYLKQFKKPRPDDPPQIFIVNYDSVWREPARRVWFYKALGIDCAICDESHKIKSPSSKCSAFLAQLAKRVPHRYAMTGTPLAENPTDVYAQYRFIDRNIFGTNFGIFCNYYENVDVEATARAGFKILDAQTPYKNLDDLREKMFSCAFQMESTVLLPPTSKKLYKVPMDDTLQELYHQMLEEGAVEMGDGFLTIDNVLSSVIRLQQLTSGYLPLEYDDGTKSLDRVSTYRRTALLKLIRTLPEDEPLVIFGRFRKDLYSIRKVAERLGCGYSEVSGSENTLAEWQEGKTRIIGVQYGAGVEGIDLTRACICIFYSIDHSLMKHDQAIKRIHRPGQTRPCTYYYVVATQDTGGKTIDQKIQLALKHKKDFVDLVMKGEKSLK